MMKKRFLTAGMAAAALLFGLVLAGCGSTPAKADDTAPVAPDLTGVTSYYVRADGNDSSAGTSEDAPFKTLAKAVEAAAKTPVKKITVIGTLTGQTDITDSGADEILITGKADGTDAEKAFLKPSDKNTDKIAIVMAGLSNIRLERITITGYMAKGILIDESRQAILTIGQDAVITGNGGNEVQRAASGGGIMVLGGYLLMQGNALVTGNYAGIGGGVTVADNGRFLMRDEARITGNTAAKSGEFIGGGGVYLENSGMAMQGSAAIVDNNAVSGGGVLISGSALTMRDNAVIKGNTANGENLLFGGGGIYSFNGKITLQGSSSITGNTAAYGGGLYSKVTTLTEEGGTVSGNTASKEGPDIYENNA